MKVPFYSRDGRLYGEVELGDHLPQNYLIAELPARMGMLVSDSDDTLTTHEFKLVVGYEDFRAYWQVDDKDLGYLTWRKKG